MILRDIKFLPSFTNSPTLLHSSDDKSKGRAHLTTLDVILYLPDLTTLHPFLDKNDVLRVGGRTGYHPVILPNKHPLARAVVLDAHTMAHLGVEWSMDSGTRNTLKDTIRSRPPTRRTQFGTRTQQR